MARRHAPAVLLAGLLGAGVASAEPPAVPAPPALPPPGSELPVGAIIAFVPQSGADAAGLDAWLAARGWAICDGRQGTPDLRERMLFGTVSPERAGEAVGSRNHDHMARGETAAPVRRNRATRTGREQLEQLPDDQHRHRVELRTTSAENLPPSVRVLFIMKLR